MSTQVVIRKLNKDIVGLKGDVREIKTLLLSLIKDPEGEYKESFIKKMLTRAKSRGPFYRFEDPRSFLKHVNSRKRGNLR